jgi:hypothetical protein
LNLKSIVFMKRAKILLTAIAVLAVVGGALAFKAKTFQADNVFCIVNSDGAGVYTCAATPQPALITTNGGGGVAANPCNYQGITSFCTQANVTTTLNVPIYNDIEL